MICVCVWCSYENIDKLDLAFEDLTRLCILKKFSADSMALADSLVKKIGVKMAAEIFAVSDCIDVLMRHRKTTCTCY